MNRQSINREIEKCEEILSYKDLRCFERDSVTKYLESLYENCDN